jgi:hypothetical protein
MQESCTLGSKLHRFRGPHDHPHTVYAVKLWVFLLLCLALFLFYESMNEKSTVSFIFPQSSFLIFASSFLSLKVLQCLPGWTILFWVIQFAFVFNFHSDPCSEFNLWSTYLSKRTDPKENAPPPVHSNWPPLPSNAHTYSLTHILFYIYIYIYIDSY